MSQPPRVVEQTKTLDNSRIDPVELSRYLVELEKRIRSLEARVAALEP